MSTSPRLLAMLLPAALAAIVALPGCFNPKLEPGFTCGDDPPGPQCPHGFFCDLATNTCLREGTEPTPGAVSLGPMQRGPVAAHRGDNVVIAGWAADPGSTAFTFRIRTYDKMGVQVGVTHTLAEFDGVDRKSLRAAGSDNAVVIAGQSPGGELQIAWVTAGGVDASTTDKTYEALTVTGSAQHVCWVAGRTPTDLGKSVMDVGCNNGTPTAVFPLTADNRRGFLALAAGVADVFSEIVVIAEVPPQAPGGLHDLFAFCPNQLAPAVPFAQRLPQGDSLEPQVFYSPANSLVQVAWKDQTELRTSKLRWPSCTSPGPEQAVGSSAATAFAMIGRARSTNWTDEPGVWSLDLHGGSSPSIGNLMTLVDTAITVDHTQLANPRALTTKDNEPWFFLHAADDVPSQGYFKYVSLEAIDQEVRYLETAQVTPDFAVARRNAGSFFLVYREDPNADGEDGPLEAYLALFDQAGDLELPSGSQ